MSPKCNDQIFKKDLRAVGLTAPVNQTYTNQIHLPEDSHHFAKLAILATSTW